MGANFGAIRVHRTNGEVEEFEKHGISTGWLVGYDSAENMQKKIPRDKIEEVVPQ